MKAKLIKPDEGLAYDITEACSSVTWSGLDSRHQEVWNWIISMRPMIPG